MNDAYILEMLITSTDRIVSEPLGIYSSMRKAKANLNKILKLRPETDAVSFNILKFPLDDKPSILKMRELAMDFYGEQLLSMYHDGMFEQMVEQDGTFSYSLTNKFKKILEKAISRFHEDKI